eukprot:CAMPEP_0182519052 /NCGR_PEP_ID=MMETSP1321-20130603/44892_1 /TAXON_ID=91990 /ORGANISM="Bolidomonas sp., Strain RCC1657" /LENGTH=52 /DNA_ID=CAMNT_0024727001 /DNA_START=756 /DNA_END=915 /DNA_ORIENTATION=-
MGRGDEGRMRGEYGGGEKGSSSGKKRISSKRATPAVNGGAESPLGGYGGEME